MTNPKTVANLTKNHHTWQLQCGSRDPINNQDPDIPQNKSAPYQRPSRCKNLDQDLTIPGKLNIKCDSCANAELPKLQQSSIFLPDPKLPSAYPHMQVHKKLIVWELANTLQYAATTHRVHGDQTWLDNQRQLGSQMECNQAGHETCQTTGPMENLQKYLHEWISYQASKWQGLIDLTLRPSCMQALEDHWHFCECTSPKHDQLYQALLTYLEKMHVKLNLETLSCTTSFKPDSTESKWSTQQQRPTNIPQPIWPSL